MTGRIHWYSAALIVLTEQHNYQSTRHIHRYRPALIFRKNSIKYAQENR